MTNEEIGSVPTRGKGDVAHSLAKAGLSFIPTVGGAAVELFNLAIAPPLEKRRDEWLASLAEGFTRLQETVDKFKVENLAENETFVTTVLHASQAALRNHQGQKLDALRNAVLNAALPDRPEDDLILMFLGLVDELTPWHLRLLKFYDDPFAWADEHGIDYPEKDWRKGGVRSKHIVNYVFPELKDQPDFFNRLVSDLHQNGFVVNLHGDPDLMEVSMVGGPRSGTLATAFAKRFLRFISSPLDNARSGKANEN